MSDTAEKVKTPRAYLTNVVLSLGGVLEATGNLHTAKDDNEAKFSKACPEHAAKGVAVKMTQRLVCAEDEEAHGLYLPGDVETMLRVNDDKTQVLVAKEEIDQAKVSDLPKNFLDIQVFTGDSTRGLLFDAGKSYVFLNTGSGRQFGFLIDILKKRTDLVLMGQVSLRGRDELYRITVDLNDQLVLRQQAWPEDIKTFETPIYEYKKALFPTMEAFVAEMAEEFTADTYTNEARAKLAALSTSAASKAQPTKKAKKAAVADEDARLEAVLTQALEQARLKKAS